MKRIIFVVTIMICCLSYATAQKAINGTVKNINGVPIFGVSVTVKGSTDGSSTNMEGKYTLKNVKETDLLVFKYIGFETQEVKVEGQTVFNITLRPNDLALDEVVVVGYGTQRKIDLTGAVESVDVDALKNTATSNFDQALAGRVAGVQVTSSDGTPGEALNIVIRGGNSITGDNSPLYVVDGIPLDDFDPASISTRDIKSFDVLKDASATAIYGARGANGVILITTNEGRTDGKIDVSFNASPGVQYIPSRLEVLSPYEYVKWQEMVALARDSYNPGLYMSEFHNRWGDAELYRNVEGKNWQDEIFQSAFVQNYSFSVGGGTEKMSLFYSGGYVDQEGTLINTSFKKYNNRMRFRSTVSDALSLNGQISYDRFIRSGIQVSGSERTSVIKDAVVTRPVTPLNDPNDEEDMDDIEEEYDETFLWNPIKTLNSTDRQRISDILRGDLSLRYKFLEKFSLNLTAGYRQDSRQESVFYGAESREAVRTSDGISATIQNIKTQTLTNSNTVSYNTKVGKSRYDGLIGTEIQNRTVFRSSLRNTNLPDEAFGINNLDLATTATIARSSASESALLSYFGRINYNYDNRYLLTANFRADGSSKFQKANRWGYFPSFAMAWRASEETFLKEVDNLTNLKFRLGYGVTGNNRIGDFNSYNLMSINPGSGTVLGDEGTYFPGAYQSNLGVPDLRWETTYQLNAGVDFGFFKNRVTGTVDYYRKRTKDLLLNAQMALSTGFVTTQQNVGEIENNGIEVTVDVSVVKNRKFSWLSSFNISFNRNKTIKLNSGETQMLIDPGWNKNYVPSEYQYVTRVGQSVGMIYGLEFDGLYQTNDFNFDGVSYTLKEGIPSYGGNPMYPGHAKFKDQNGDGLINTEDRVIIGNPLPKHTGGWANDFKYRNFDLSVLLQWAYDFDILNANKAEFGRYVSDTRSGYPELLNVWTPLNTDTDGSGIRFQGNSLAQRNGWKIDNRYVDDGSYLKLKTVVMGYTLSPKLIKTSTIKSCRFYLSGQNLLVLTNYKGYDPDVSVGRYGALTPGLDYSAYPQSVAFSAGVDIKF